MSDLLDAISEYIREHWIEGIVAAGFMLAGWFLGRRRERAKWKNKDFLNRLNISLNIIENGKLFIRTLVEKSCLDVFLNEIAVEKLVAASKLTREDAPLLDLPKEEYWYYLNSVLNEVSEKFAYGQLRRDTGQSVVNEKYLISLTYERAGDIRTHKFRAMIVKKSTLENLPKEQPQLESPNHLTRWKTLNILADEYRKTPYRFLEMELSL